MPVFRELVWVGLGIQEALGWGKLLVKFPVAKLRAWALIPRAFPAEHSSASCVGLLHPCCSMAAATMAAEPLCAARALTGLNPRRPQQAQALTSPSSCRPRPSQAHSGQGYIQRVPECLGYRGSAAPHSAGQAGPSFSVLVPTGPTRACVNRGYTAKLGMETWSVPVGSAQWSEPRKSEMCCLTDSCPQDSLRGGLTAAHRPSSGAALPLEVWMELFWQYSFQEGSSICDFVLPCAWLITALPWRFLNHFRFSLNHQIQELMHSLLHPCSIYKDLAISFKPHIFPLSLTAQ